MTDLEQIQKLNGRKHLIKKGDLVISKSYGIGRVNQVLYDEDVWNPVEVRFEIQLPISIDGKSVYVKSAWCDASGGIEDDMDECEFYRKLETRPKEDDDWMECDRCDGCGWYEGGKALITSCEVCGGCGKIKKGIADEKKENGIA